MHAICDFSLHAVRSRLAKIGDQLTTHIFNWATTGFCAPEDEGMAVCLLPGTEVSFADQFGEVPRSPGRERRSATKPQSAGKSTNINRTPTMMRWSSQMATSFSSDKPGRRAASQRPSIASAGRNRSGERESSGGSSPDADLADAIS